MDDEKSSLSAAALEALASFYSEQDAVREREMKLLEQSYASAVSAVQRSCRDEEQEQDQEQKEEEPPDDGEVVKHDSQPSVQRGTAEIERRRLDAFLKHDFGEDWQLSQFWVSCITVLFLLIRPPWGERVYYTYE